MAWEVLALVDDAQPGVLRAAFHVNLLSFSVWNTPVLQVKKTDTKTWLTAAANSSLPAGGGGKGVEMSLRSVCYAPDCDNEAFSLLEVLVR